MTDLMLQWAKPMVGILLLIAMVWALSQIVF